MGREFPVVDQNNVAELSHHPFITMSLFIASIVSTIALVSSMCGALSRRKSAPSSSVDDENHEDMKENKDVNVPVLSPTDDHPSKDSLFSKTTPDSENATQNEEFLQQPLPPPPGMRNLTGAASCHFRSSSSASTSSLSQLKKLPASMSMRVLGNGIGMVSKQLSKRDQENTDNKKKDKKLKHEDSIWKKTIILGEKCKVPDEDDDTVLYDEKGNRISTYHRKTTSMALSRQNSSIDPDAIPSSFDQGLKDEIQRK